MTENKHRPTPWRVCTDDSVCDAEDEEIACLDTSSYFVYDSEDFHHSVRCVNKIAAISQVLNDWEEKPDVSNLKTLCKIGEIIGNDE